jgi:hypothetical protein
MIPRHNDVICAYRSNREYGCTPEELARAIVQTDAFKDALPKASGPLKWNNGQVLFDGEYLYFDNGYRAIISGAGVGLGYPTDFYLNNTTGILLSFDIRDANNNPPALGSVFVGQGTTAIWQQAAADGTYTIGASLTPGGSVGQIMMLNGVVVAVQQAT